MKIQVFAFQLCNCHIPHFGMKSWNASAVLSILMQYVIWPYRCNTIGNTQFHRYIRYTMISQPQMTASDWLSDVEPFTSFEPDWILVYLNWRPILHIYNLLVWDVLRTIQLSFNFHTRNLAMGEFSNDENYLI